MALKEPIPRGPNRTVKFDGELLRAYRQQANKSQEQLANEARVDVSTVKRSEKGVGVSWDCSQQIIGALDIQGDQPSCLIAYDSANPPIAIKSSSQLRVNVTQNILDLVLDIPRTQTSNDSRFLYNSSYINFVGRETVLSELRDFCNRPERFLWWHIVGPGGIGKSRLAFHFCQMLEEEGSWKAGFLYRTHDQQKAEDKDIEESLLPWESCQPAKPTLIVVDHVAARAPFLGKLVYRLARRDKSHPLLNPVRLLLIERDPEGIWKENFSKTQDRVIRSFQATSQHSDRPLILQPLDDNSLWDIIQVTSGAEINDKQHLLEQLDLIDPQRRPLFAAFLGDAIKLTGSPRRWDQEALLTDFLEHNQKEYWVPAGINDADKIWLCLATLTGGAFASWLDDPKLGSVLNLPTIDDRMLVHRYSVMTGQRPELNAGVPEFNPLKPDVLGEFFVLKFLTDKDNLAWLKQLTLCLNAAWEKRPLYMAEFLRRIEEDFFDYRENVENLDRLACFYIAPLSADNNVLLSWYSLMQNRATFFTVRKGTAALALNIYNEIIDHFENSSMLQADNFVASALHGKMNALLVLGRHDEVIATYDVFWAKSKDSFQWYVMKKKEIGSALFLKATALSHLGRDHEAIATFSAVLANFDVGSEAISDDVRADFEVSFETWVRPLVIGAICGKAFALWKVGRAQEAKAFIESNKSALADMPNAAEAVGIEALLANIDALLK